MLNPVKNPSYRENLCYIIKLFIAKHISMAITCYYFYHFFLSVPSLFILLMFRFFHDKVMSIFLYNCRSMMHTDMHKFILSVNVKNIKIIKRCTCLKSFMIS